MDTWPLYLMDNRHLGSKHQCYLKSHAYKKQQQQSIHKLQSSRHLRSTSNVNETKQFVVLINNEFMHRVIHDTHTQQVWVLHSVCVIQLSQVLLEGRARFTGGATAVLSPYWSFIVPSAYQERTQSISLLFLDEIQMSPGRVWICKKKAQKR